MRSPGRRRRSDGVINHNAAGAACRRKDKAARSPGVGPRDCSIRCTSSWSGVPRRCAGTGCSSPRRLVVGGDFDVPVVVQDSGWRSIVLRSPPRRKRVTGKWALINPRTVPSANSVPAVLGQMGLRSSRSSSSGDHVRCKGGRRCCWSPKPLGQCCKLLNPATEYPRS